MAFVLRTHHAAIVVLIIAMALSACRGDSPPTAPTAVVPVVRGRVLDFQTQTPISGAMVGITTDPFLAGTETVTDVSGQYSLPQPPYTGRFYYFIVNGLQAGRGYPAGANYRGELLVDAGTCVSRYGLVMDAQTLRPIAAASVASSGNTGTTTSRDGWYRIDWGCPSSGTIGFNTTFLTASHPDYASQQQTLGRGIQHVQRLDFILQGR